jgi:hypothetical protein
MSAGSPRPRCPLNSGPFVRTDLYAIGTTTAQEGRDIAELTLDNLHRTIEKYGPEGVLETARDAGFSFADLVALQERIDRLPRTRKQRRTAEERVRTFLGLDDEKEG